MIDIVKARLRDYRNLSRLVESDTFQAFLTYLTKEQLEELEGLIRTQGTVASVKDCLDSFALLNRIYSFLSVMKLRKFAREKGFKNCESASKRQLVIGLENVEYA